MAQFQQVSDEPLVMYVSMDHNESKGDRTCVQEHSFPLETASNVDIYKKKLLSTLDDQKVPLSDNKRKAAHIRSTAQRKLIQASLICALFMVIETVAGVWSNSLALLTDASHLLSDLSSFLISLFALWVATLPGTWELSFGYHRAEILGALISILAIWFLTLFLMVEAYKRFSNPSPVNGSIMFFTAFIGTLANLAMTYILGIHSHGIGSQCSQGHSHSESQGLHHHHYHAQVEDCPAGYAPIKTLHHDSSPDDRDTKLTVLSQQETTENKDSWDNGHTVACESKAPSPLPQPFCVTPNPHEGCEPPPRLQRSSPQSYSLIPSPPANCATYLSSFFFPMMEADPKSSVTHNDDHNVNLRAAYLHAAGDLIQNVGVLLAATLIWIKPSWSIVDPLCTFFFSLLVLATTVSILLEAMNVLMEGVPKEVNLHNLQKDLQQLPSVVEVHDLHVWSLSVGKPSLAGHIVVDSQNEACRVLKDATEVCQKKYGILHTTIQIDYSTNKQSCDTDAHLKCH